MRCYAVLKYSARVRRGVVARNVTPESDGWVVHCDDEAIRCHNLVLATGKLGLRGIDDSRDRTRVGLKMHLCLSDDACRSLTGCVELYFVDCSYAGLEFIEDRIANLCLLMPRDLIARPLAGDS